MKLLSAFQIVAVFFLFTVPIRADNIKLGQRPLFLIRGWGPAWITRMRDLAGFFISDGMKRVDIHEISYPYRGSPLEIKESISKQMRTIFKKYPASTQFDAVSHSLGQFAGLYAVLESAISERFVIYAALAGDVHGQESIPDSPLWGETVETLIPYKNPFIVDFLTRHDRELKKLKKCSLYSRADRLVTAPRDSGAFSDGMNIELDSIGHLEFIHSKKAYQVLTSRCVFP